VPGRVRLPARRGGSALLAPECSTDRSSRGVVDTRSLAWSAEQHRTTICSAFGRPAGCRHPIEVMTEVAALCIPLTSVTFSPTARRPDRATTTWIAEIVAVAVLGLIALAGCGSSSKPAYCSARADLESSIQGVSSLSPSSGIGTLQATFEKVQTAANKVVTQAKSDFPNETSALKSSMDALSSAVNALKANPSAGQILTVTSAASNALSSVKSFVDATSSKCS